MKITIDHAALAEAASWAAQALSSRPAVPVLAGMLLEATGGTLTVSAFDYETSSTSAVKADVEEEGAAVLPGRLLAEITRKLPALDVSITTSGTRADLTCGQARFSLPEMPAGDYPSLPDLPPVAGTIGSVTFAEAATQVSTAAGRDDTLPVLTGVLIEPDGGTLTLVATDRYRLAVREVAWDAVALDMAPVIIPAQALALAAKAMTGGDVVQICIGGDMTAGQGMAGFAGAGRTLTTRLLGGDFPRYANLLPKETPLAAIVASAPLTEAVKRAALVAERNTAVRLSFTPGALKVAAGTGDEAAAEEIIEAGWDEGEFSIAFNPGYLLDGLSALGDGQIRCGFTGEGKPAVLTCVLPDGQEPDYTYLLMPVRLGT